MKTNKEFKEKELEKVTGGTEPEEFDWKPKGYETPVKEQNENADWAFSAIGNKEENDNK